MKTETPVIDHAVIQALNGLFDDPAQATTFLNDLIAIYRDAGAETLAELNSTLRAGDTRGIEAKAHKLKGLSRNIGARRLGDLCAELEVGARADAAPAAAAALCETLAGEFRASCDELGRKYLKAG